MLKPYSRILIVDDSATARKCIRRVLNNLGFHFVREANDGRDAMTKLSTQPFDLVISDWDMEEIDGLALLKWIRQSTTLRQMPFIMATGFSGRKFREIARDNGATFFVEKPIFSHQFAALLGRIEGTVIAA